MFEKLDRYRPYVIRLLARKNHGLSPLTHREIALRGGLPKSTVVFVSLQTSWDTIHLGTIRKFLKGCGVNLNKMHHHREFLTRSKWKHCEHCSPQQQKFLNRLLKLRPS